MKACQSTTSLVQYWQLTIYKARTPKSCQFIRHSEDSNIPLYTSNYSASLMDTCLAMCSNDHHDYLVPLYRRRHRQQLRRRIYIRCSGIVTWSVNCGYVYEMFWAMHCQLCIVSLNVKLWTDRIMISGTRGNCGLRVLSNMCCRRQWRLRPLFHRLVSGHLMLLVTSATPTASLQNPIYRAVLWHWAERAKAHFWAEVPEIIP